MSPTVWARRSSCCPDVSGWLYVGETAIGCVYLDEHADADFGVPMWCFRPSGGDDAPGASEEVWVMPGPSYESFEQAVRRIASELARDAHALVDETRADALEAVEPATIPILPAAEHQ